MGWFLEVELPFGGRGERGCGGGGLWSCLGGKGWKSCFDVMMEEVLPGPVGGGRVP